MINTELISAIHATMVASQSILRYCKHVGGIEDNEVKILSGKAIDDILIPRFKNHNFVNRDCTSTQHDSDNTWYINQLDNMSGSVNDIPTFGISIGKIHKGKIVLGVLYFPALDLLVYAEKGIGVWSVKNTTVEDVSVSSSRLICNTSNMVGNSDSYELAKIGLRHTEKIYLPNTLQNVVAGICIVTEAGCNVTDERGKPWSINSKFILITKNDAG